MVKTIVQSKAYVRIPVTACMAIVVAITVPVAQTPCDSLLSSGDAAYGEFNNKKALERYRDAWQQCGNRYDALFKYTRTINDVGEDNADPDYFERAMRYADTLQRRYPDSMQGYFLKAAAAGNLTGHRGGKRLVELSRIVNNAIRDAIRIAPDYAPAHVILGSYYFNVAQSSAVLRTVASMLFGSIPEGTNTDALRELHAALDLDSTNLYAHYNISLTHLAMGDTAKARRHLRKVKELPVKNHFHPRLRSKADSLLSKL